MRNDQKYDFEEDSMVENESIVERFDSIRFALTYVDLAGFKLSRLR